MLTVAVYINSVPVIVRSCRNVADDGKLAVYSVDDGRTIRHEPKGGAVKLAIALLKGVKNP